MYWKGREKRCREKADKNIDEREERKEGGGRERKGKERKGKHNRIVALCLCLKSEVSIGNIPTFRFAQSSSICSRHFHICHFSLCISRLSDYLFVFALLTVSSKLLVVSCLFSCLTVFLVPSCCFCLWHFPSPPHSLLSLLLVKSNRNVNENSIQRINPLTGKSYWLFPESFEKTSNDKNKTRTFTDKY